MQSACKFQVSQPASADKGVETVVPLLVFFH